MAAPSRHYDARFQSLLNLVPQVNDWYVQKKRQPPFKVVIVVGDQSSGKSAVVQRFVGFPVNITKKETGTRRPLKIILRYSAEHREPKCVLDGHEMNRSQVLKEVWKINNELAKQNKFEFKPLVLEVTSAEVISITLIDLPGLKYTQEKTDTNHVSSSDHRQRIQEIIREHIKGGLGKSRCASAVTKPVGIPTRAPKIRGFRVAQSSVILVSAGCLQ